MIPPRAPQEAAHSHNSAPRYILFELFFAKVLLSITLLAPLSCSAGGRDAAAAPINAEIPAELSQLQRAYPDMIRKVTPSSIEMYDGTVMDYLPRAVEFETMLDSPTLFDQMTQSYPKGRPEAPAENHDPGRIRYQPFFQKMYGSTKQVVQKNLVTVSWMPKYDGTKLQVTRINGVSDKLQRVSERLEKLPAKLRAYARKPAGFNWRVIEDTGRLSPHSYGIAVDIAVAKSHYWLWDQKRGSFKWVDDFPYEIVEIFESEGFIWGGRWYHYDSMHFEYRPELLP